MLLEVSNLTKIYTTQEFLKERKFLSLDNVSFSLEDGESLSVIGSSGSGKTTLGRILARILDFDAGTVKYFGKNINDYKIAELSAIVQMVFQNPYASLDPKMKIKNSLAEADKNPDNINAALKSVDLDANILDNYPHQFSGGQRQRIAIARALLKKPKLIIADEPFASLDIYSQNQIMEIFTKVARTEKISIILITHDISAASKFADRMLIMEKGKLIKDDSFNNLAADTQNKYMADLLQALEL